MLETLRLYPPAPHIHREIASAQTLQTSSGTLHLPAGMRSYIEFCRSPLVTFLEKH